MKNRAGVIKHPEGWIMAGLFRQRFMRPDNEAEDPKQPITDLSKCSFWLLVQRKPQEILRTKPPVSPIWGHTSDPRHTPSTHFCQPPFQTGPLTSQTHGHSRTRWGGHRVPQLRTSQTRTPHPTSISIKSPEMLKPCGSCLEFSSPRGGCDPPREGDLKAHVSPPRTSSSQHDGKVPLLDRILLAYKEQTRTVLTTMVPVVDPAPCRDGSLCSDPMGCVLGCHGDSASSGVT